MNKILLSIFAILLLSISASATNMNKAEIQPGTNCNMVNPKESPATCPLYELEQNNLFGLAVGTITTGNQILWMMNFSQYAGITIITGIHPYTQNDLENFKGNCIFTTCTESKLIELSSNKVLSRIWWNITTDQRKTFAMRLVNHTNAKFDYITYVCDQKGYCRDVTTQMCRFNTMMRSQTFNGSIRNENLKTYTYRAPNGTMTPYYQYVTYDLPSSPVIIRGLGTAHTVSGIQIGTNRQDINSWLFFQYYDYDIRPGSWQMPYGGYSVQVIENPTITWWDIYGENQNNIHWYLP